MSGFGRPKAGEANNKWLVFSCVTLGTMMIALNNASILVALPSLAADLQIDLEQASWTIMIYALMVTAFLPTIGRVSDMLGRKYLYVLGFAVFTAASLFCGLSDNYWQLLVARLIQGLGGSLLLANSTPIITDTFPSNELGKALGLYQSLFSVGSMIGPVFGGILTVYGWRYIFFFNIPIGIIGTIWACYNLPKQSVLKQEQAFDLAGAFTFLAGLSSILIVLTMGNDFGWLSYKIILTLILGLSLLMTFVIIEKRIKEPMLDLALFKTRFLVAAFLLNFLNGLSTGSLVYLLTFYYQNLRGFSSAETGLLLAPYALSIILFAPVSGILSDRFGSHWLCSTGFLLMLAGFLGLSQVSVYTPKLLIAAYTLIIGIGGAVFNSPNSKAVMGTVSPNRRGIAGGIRAMLFQMGFLASIAVSTAVVGAGKNAQAAAGNSAQLWLLQGLQHAFIFFMFISLLGAVISFTRGKNSLVNCGVAE